MNRSVLRWLKLGLVGLASVIALFFVVITLFEGFENHQRAQLARLMHEAAPKGLAGVA